MRASLLVLLVAVRAVVGGTNRSLVPDGTETHGSCVPSILESVLLSADSLPEWVLSLKRIAMEVTGGAPKTEQLLRTLKEHPELTAIAVSLSRPPEYAAVVYRLGDQKIQSHQLSNFSVLDRTWRRLLDADWNQNHKVSDVTGFWTPLFLDCLTQKWLFGYTVSSHRYSKVWALIHAPFYFPLCSRLTKPRLNTARVYGEWGLGGGDSDVILEVEAYTSRLK
jgi:hypothetical protein